MVENSKPQFNKGLLDEIKEDIEKERPVTYKKSLRLSPRHMEAPKKNKKRIFFTLMFSLFVNNILYMNVSTILPNFVEENHRDVITNFMVGIILGLV